MISIVRIDKTRIKDNEEFKTAELRGLSTDDKPTKIDESNIDNGSVFIEIDTGKMFFYDLENELWKEV